MRRFGHGTRDEGRGRRRDGGAGLTVGRRSEATARRRGVAEGDAGSHHRIPRHLRGLFWDHHVHALRWDRDRDFVVGRLLGRGPWSGWRWVRRELGDDALRDWFLRTQGRALTARQLRFWQLVLGLAAGRVTRWIAARKASRWHTRTRRRGGTPPHRGRRDVREGGVPRGGA